MNAEVELLVKSQGGFYQLGQAQGEMGEFIRRVWQDYSKILELWINDGPLAENEQLRNTNFHLLNSHAPACFVSPNDNGYLIGLTVGFPVMLLDTFLALMSSPLFFKEVGAATQEVAWQTAPPSEMFRAALPLHAPPSDDLRTAGFWQVPQSLARIRFAFDLCYDALEFLLYHELAHLYRGHLSLQEKVLGYGTLTEEETVPTHCHEPQGELSVIELNQFLELDADRCASECLLYPSLPEPPAAALAAEKKQELNRRLFAVIVLFLLQFKAKPLAHFSQARYPHPRVRHALVIAYTMSAIFGEREISVAQASAELAPFLTNLKHFSDVFGPCIPLVDSNQKDAINQTTEERLAFYERVQSTIFPLLDATRNHWSAQLPANLPQET